MNRKVLVRAVIFLSLAAALLCLLPGAIDCFDPDIGRPGGPIAGLTPVQLKKFHETREIFKHDFTPEEGLGPLFNGRSCFECHGKSTILGGEGRDVTSTGVVRIGQLRAGDGRPPSAKPVTDLGQDDVDLMIFQGGPAIERKSITSEFPEKYPPGCQVELGMVPQQADFISLRHAPPLFGFGLIEAIPDAEIVGNIFKQAAINPKLKGRAATHIDPLTYQPRIGRFGWKNQNPNLMTFTTEALNVEMGITTFTQEVEKSATGIQRFPKCIVRFLPPEPNDPGSVTAKLTYFQALLAPPPRGRVDEAARRGEAVFNRLQCSVCHIPEMSTAPVVWVVDPDSPAPDFNYLEVQALENKPVRAYSDFLLHDMGEKLADGLPQAGARGGQWRTTPLWGLRLKKFLLHDGRTSDISQAILEHGGQASDVVAAYRRLPDADRDDLLSFLRSL